MPVIDIDAYIAAAPEKSRPMLRQIREAIWAAAPDAEETISYQIPAFKLNGMLVGFAAFKKHCGFYTMSATLLDSYQDEVSAYKTSKGTIQFPYGTEIPKALIEMLTRARIEENAAIKAAK